MGVDTSIGARVLSVVLVMFSAIIHEVAHGWMAYKLGDPTAKMAGRLTLNPAAHLDGFGSIVLPALMALSGGPMIAFAKPVPYNPYNLRNPKRDEVLVALAGPASNLLQAVVAGIIFRIAAVSMPLSQGTYVFLQILIMYVMVNLSLMFFNLIPLPPLDGSSLLSIFIPEDKMDSYYQLQHYSMPILLVLLYLVPTVLHVDPVGNYLGGAVGWMMGLILGF